MIILPEDKRGYLNLDEAQRVSSEIDHRVIIDVAQARLVMPVDVTALDAMRAFDVLRYTFSNGESGDVSFATDSDTITVQFSPD